MVWICYSVAFHGLTLGPIFFMLIFSNDTYLRTSSLTHCNPFAHFATIVRRSNNRSDENVRKTKSVPEAALRSRDVVNKADRWYRVDRCVDVLFIDDGGLIPYAQISSQCTALDLTFSIPLICSSPPSTCLPFTWHAHLLIQDAPCNQP